MGNGLHNLFGFRAWLFFLASFAVLPMVAFSFFSVLELVESQRDLERLQLVRRASTAAETVNRHLTSWVSMLNAVAHSQAARDSDLRILYRHTKRLVPITPGLLSMSLVDADGVIYFNTGRPFGDVLPHTSQPEAARRVIESGRPGVSDSGVGVISKQTIVILGVPVWINNEVKYTLRAVMAVQNLETLLQSDNLPQGWGVALLDSKNHVLACFGLEAGDLLGFGDTQPPTGIGSDIEGLRFLSLDGDPGLAAVSKVGNWGWSVVVTVPRRLLAAPLRRLLVQCVLAGGLCLGLGFACSFWLSRKLAGEMDMVSAASANVAAGRSGLLAERPMIRELDEVRACLWEARDREMQAKIDAVTQLPGRIRFWELAKATEQRCLENDSLGLAVMFVDLDGFKQVNDRFGHDRGDWVLSQAAQAIRGALRDGDVTGRMGGDEFAVCLVTGRGQLFEAASSVAERIVLRVGQVGYGISCSVGVSVCAVCAPSLERALGLADAAMYEAKRLGKNRYILHEDTTREEPPTPSGSSA